jgi:hypothetical protein
MGFSGNLFRTLPILILLFLKEDKLVNISKFFSRTLALIILPSLILHIILLFVDLPSFGTLKSDGIVSYYVYENYIILFKNFINYKYRFCCIFFEPGYFAALSVFILIINNFDFSKKSNLIILIGIIFSLSLSGFILLSLSYVYYFFMKFNNRAILTKFVIVVSSIWIIYLIGVNYNGGANYLNKYIIERLQPDEDKVIKGNNRFATTTDDYYFFIQNNMNIFWNGVGQDTFVEMRDNDEIWGAGYKMFIISYGM